MQWANLGKFSFGNLNGVQQGLYEDNPELAMQQVLNWAGGNNPNFANTVMGRWLSSQQKSLHNNFITAQAAQLANPVEGQAPLTLTKWLEDYANSGKLQNEFALLPGYMRGVNPGAYRVRRELG
jgi:hypothetical protein